MSSGAPGRCDACGETTWLLPLHGEKGGPLRCFKCAGEWNAIHGRLRKAGRVVIKALKFYEEAGGRSTDLTKLWLAASGLTIPGYEDTLGAEIGDMTSELLADVVETVSPRQAPGRAQGAGKPRHATNTKRA
jgi:hypothetical protein